MEAEEGLFALPWFPLEMPVDTAGGGDAFAGWMVGFLAQHGGSLDEPWLRLAMAHGTAVASFTVEQFSVDGLLDLDRDAVGRRVRQIRDLVRFDPELPARG